MRGRETFVFLHDPIDKAAEQGLDVILQCRNDRCAHEKRMTATALAQICSARGWNRTINFIGGKLRCAACGRNWPIIRVVQQLQASSCSSLA